MQKMNNTIKKIDLKDCCFFDIETSAKNKELTVDSREYDLWQWKNRNRDTDEYLPDEELQALYKKIAALKIGFNKVITIGVGFVHNGEVRIKALVGTEEEIIKEFFNYTRSFKYLVSFNGIGFDMPVLLANGNTYFDVTDYIPDHFNTSQKKIWDLKQHTDLLEVIKGTHYTNISFDEACYMFNVDSPKDDIKGSDVNRVFYEGGIDRIVRYVKKDVFSLINLFEAVRHNERYTEFKDVSDTLVEKTPVLNRIYSSSEITQADIEEIEKLISKKRLTKKDRKNLFTILRGVYIKTDFENNQQDSKKVIEQKEAEIQEIIDNL